MIGFVIWALVGAAIIGLGTADLFAKKPVGFWANAKTMEVKDVKGYNRATGTMFIVYGIVFILLGLPLLGEQKVLIMFSGIGVMFITIGMMAFYSTYIVKKYGADVR